MSFVKAGLRRESFVKAALCSKFDGESFTYEDVRETFYLAARESFIEAALIEIVVKFKLVDKVNARSDFRTSQTNYGLQTDSKALNYSKALADIRQRTQVRVRFSRTASLKRGQKDHFRAFGVKEG